MGAAGPRRTYHPLLHSDTFIALVRGLVTNDSTAVSRRDGGARAGESRQEEIVDTPVRRDGWEDTTREERRVHCSR